MNTGLDFLVGATVIDVSYQPFGDSGDVLELAFRLDKPVQMFGVETSVVVCQVWRDEEGNGPGELSVVAGGPESFTPA